MKTSLSGVAAVLLIGALTIALSGLVGPQAARADGTVLIQQSNGHRDTYDDVVIKVIHSALYLTSADGHGTIVINRAACSYQGQLMVCLPTSAALVQSGKTSALDFKSGTLYLNDTDDAQQLSMSTAKVPPHGILLSFTTQRGTYVNLSGRIDKVVK